MWFIVLLTLGVLQPCRAGFDRAEAGARAAALGGAFTAVGGDIWAPAYNVGGLSRLGQAEASFFISPSPFGLPELSFQAGTLGIPTSLGVIGIAASKFGDQLYQELTGTISYAKSIPHAGFGISIHYHAARIARYGSAGAIALDAGILVDASQQLRIGLSVRNATASVVGVSREPLPQIYAMGAAYAPAGNVLLALDFRKESGVEPSVRFGFECRIVDPIALRWGFSEGASVYSGGVGIRSASLRVDYAFTVHAVLGWTHEVTLSIRWGGHHD